MAKVKVKQIEADTSLIMGNTYTGDKFRIEDMADPVNPFDAVNLRSLLSYTGISSATLSGLTDVMINNPVDNQVIVYSGGTWYNVDYSGGGVTTLSGLTDVTINAPFEKEFLIYSGGTWINTPDIYLESGNYIYTGEWRIFEDGDNLRVEKNVSGLWELGGEFFV